VIINASFVDILDILWGMAPLRNNTDIRKSMGRRKGFFIFFGTRNMISSTGPAVTAVCPRCAKQGGFENKAARTWFTLFFIPVFPMGASRPFCQCQNCQAQYKGSAEALGKKTAVSQQQLMQRAIQMYNSMRASPSNSVTLNNLLLLYLQIGELNQAISAANEFPDALNASEQCMTTLGRVLLEKLEHAAAIKWFDAAIARNPMLGEASYCKAVALMGMNPPDLSGATLAARAARSAGLPEADTLLRELEKRSRAV
jgi:tetratricopeptide (TPR) repeat protein